MAITLTVENGTGRGDANALIALNDFKSYCDDQGLSYAGFADDALNGAIVRSSAFLTNAFVWQGSKINGREQTMAFPRNGLVDRDGWSVPNNEVPREIKAACCEVALYEATNPGAMNPSVVLADKVRSEQVGSIRVEYASLFNNATDSRPTLTVVSDLVAAFVATGGSALVGMSYRV